MKQSEDSRKGTCMLVTTEYQSRSKETCTSSLSWIDVLSCAGSGIAIGRVPDAMSTCLDAAVARCTLQVLCFSP